VCCAVPEYRDRLEEMTAEAPRGVLRACRHKRTYEIAAVYERHAA
jgi:hypothetical protein